VTHSLLQQPEHPLSPTASTPSSLFPSFPQSREGVRGCCWFLDADLSRGVALKRDKSGAALLQLLRHLGRLKEVRVGWGMMLRLRVGDCLCGWCCVVNEA
jgi:hypothetical protein